MFNNDDASFMGGPAAMPEGEAMEKVWEIKDPEAFRRGKKAPSGPRPVPREQKDPAKAYNLSMFYWGGGQLYNDQIVKGTAFLVSLLLVVAGIVLFAIYDEELLQFLRARGTSLTSAFLVGEVLLFLVLLFWVSNAADAYRAAARTRKTRFPGVPSRVTPFLSSCAIPGWGQFLNGQPIKGSIFSVLAVIGIFSVPAVVLTFLAWPQLDATDTRFLVEGISAVCLFIVPLVPLLWALGAYDALKVSRNDLLKEPLWERLKAAYYRARTQGIVRGVFPQIKGTFLLILFLAFLVIVIHYWFPTGFYAGLLASVQTILRDRGMTIVPELIDRLLEVIGRI
jgi:TM2 domain-containing membrane protein YozV